VKITYSLFPKFYSSLDVRALAALVRGCGLDAVNAVVREGYWVEPASLAEDLPAFTEAMRAEGVGVPFATTGLSADDIIRDDTPLRVMADAGIRDFRTGYFREEGGDPRASLASAREKLTQLAPLCEKAGVRAVYQLHHGTLVPGPSAAWPLVEGLPPEAIGVELDPGNQALEGLENWGRSCRLLGEYVAALAVKDVRTSRDESRAEEPGKGWRKSWVPVYEGETNWHDVTRALAAIQFEGTFVFMPFYDQNDPDAMTRKLKREVAYLRKVVAAEAASAE
jgi:sugar phosphate isomerase/epimerase